IKELQKIIKYNVVIMSEEKNKTKCAIYGFRLGTMLSEQGKTLHSVIKDIPNSDSFEFKMDLISASNGRIKLDLNNLKNECGIDIGEFNLNQLLLEQNFQ